jgi:hypothetical protein
MTSWWSSVPDRGATLGGSPPHFSVVQSAPVSLNLGPGQRIDRVSAPHAGPLVHSTIPNRKPRQRLVAHPWARTQWRSNGRRKPCAS